MSIEVERKFVCDADFMTKLKDKGGKCVGQQQFQDQYFDSPDCVLTLQDYWLRRRQGLWELKCPAVSESGPQNKAQALCTRYREITSFSQIQAEVQNIISGRCGSSLQDAGLSSDADCGRWLSELNLQCFAEFTTDRCSYTLTCLDGAVRVDLDQADFGYCVGEIEVLVPDGGDTSSALQTITRISEELGLHCEQRVQGKMDVYLQRYRPDHYEKLLNAHVF